MTEPSNRWLATGSIRGDQYDARYDALAAAGNDVHGEANFVEVYGPASVMDAGCGTGRVGRELARRGLDVVGVDLDPAMLETARNRSPSVAWHLADLSTVQLGRSFDAVVLAGNVMIFVTPGTEGAVVANMAAHLAAGGVLIAGFQLMPGRLGLTEYDEVTTASGLVLADRFATWERSPWSPGGNYAVSVHRKPN